MTVAVGDMGLAERAVLLAGRIPASLCRRYPA